MSKIVFLGPPAHGHVNPTLPVIQELIQRGEQVIYYNNEDFRAKIEPTGAIFRAYPPTELTSAVFSELLLDGNLASVSAMVLRVAEKLTPFMLDELSREQPDLVIFDSLAVWGKIAAGELNLRAAASITHFVFDMASLGLSVRQFVTIFGLYLTKVPGILASRFRLSRRYPKGFATNGPLFPMRDKLNLVFTSRELHPDAAIIDGTFHFVGPSINPQTRGEIREDIDFEALEQQQVVYISLGTIHTSTEFYKQCFEAFADYPVTFILSIGTEAHIAALGKIPPNFIVRASVPQLEVLQHADAFITHGGMNSIHEGLYYGVPLIVFPQQFEQMMNGRIVEAHGAAIVIGDQSARGHVTTAELQSALDKVLSEPRYREAAGEVQKTLRATGGYRQAADEIQAYIAS